MLAGCGPQQEAPAPEQSDSTTPKAAESNAAPAIGSFGFDSAGMDRAVRPGDDFYDYANGAWMQSTAIAADRSSESVFSALAEKARLDTRTLLEEAAADITATGSRKQIGDYYAAFMDEATLEARGSDPVKPELDAIAAVSDMAGLSRALGAKVRADVDLLNATDYYTDRPFGLWVSPDLTRPDQYAAYLVQGGLGMPDRDFYLEGGRMADLRDQYQVYMADLFELGGFADAKARAERVLALEVAIAQAHATQLQTSDVERGANHWTTKDFQAKAPGIDWPAFFEAAGLDKREDIIVWQPDAVTGMAGLVSARPLSTWKDYLRFHAIDRAAPYLSKTFVDRHFAFHEKALSGTPELGERWKRAVDATNDALGEAVGQRYVADHFSAQTKARAEEMVQNLIRAFGKRIDAADWMSAPTKTRARTKLLGLRVEVGYPERWRDYASLDVRRDDAYGNAQRAALFEYQRNLAKLGKPIDRGEWFLLPQMVNALNVPLENRLIFPAAILQAPFFDAAADDAVNYGGIGGVIGHEISHSFDNSGALFDETGKLENWWTKDDFARFEAAGAALAAQYDQYKPFPDLALNGKLTLGENIADVAGLATAHDAYRASHAGETALERDGFSPDQRFFLGWAQVWRSKYRDQSLRNRILTNGHAPGHYRALTVRNIDAWYPAYSVEPGQALYLSPNERVKVW